MCNAQLQYPTVAQSIAAVKEKKQTASRVRLWILQWTVLSSASGDALIINNHNAISVQQRALEAL